MRDTACGYTDYEKKARGRGHLRINNRKPAWWNRLIGLPAALWSTITGLWSDAASTWGAQDDFETLRVDEQELRRLEAEWKRSASSPPGGSSAGPLNAEELRLVERIREATRGANRNNVTRTAAYLELYRKRPELHWALLAHMVSRNGGWSMTDLKGDLLPRLLRAAQRERIFSMLEDSNAFIFGDAYPQLLLYEHSLAQGRPLFHLLPTLHVSAFMRPLWERFWVRRDSVLLTIGLIVNEQHFIEGRIVQDPDVAEHVLGTLAFEAQSALQLNQVVFPYGGVNANAAGGQRLAGLILESFGSLNERIEFGKKLYAILFGIPQVAEGAVRFAVATPHRGTRADYWPQLYATSRLVSPAAEYKERLEGGELRPGAAPFYSPRLSDAWPDRPLRTPQRYDWFRDARGAAKYFTDVRPPYPYEMGAEHLFGLRKLELAALAKAALL
jgi:hypothetical protein